MTVALSPSIVRSPARAAEPDRRRERFLLRRYCHTGDLGAREELIERFLPFARKLAGRYAHAAEFDDLEQVACMGLIKAVDRFEPERGSRFASFAAPTILGELKRHIRDKGWALRVPRDLQERSIVVRRASERLSKELRRSATAREIAEATALTVEGVIEAQEVAGSYRVFSLDAPPDSEEDPGPLSEVVGRRDDGYSMVDDGMEMAAGWARLTDLQREVVRLRFVDNLTQREIGQRVGYSQMHVSRQLARALSILQGG